MMLYASRDSGRLSVPSACLGYRAHRDAAVPGGRLSETLGEEIDQGADLRRELAIGDEVGGETVTERPMCNPVQQYPHQRPRLQVLPHRECGQQRQAKPAHGGVAPRLAVVRAEVSIDRDALRLRLARERPGVAAHCGRSVEDAVVPMQAVRV